MKKRIKLTSGITLINKKFKKREFYHYFEEPNNVIIIPKINNHFILVKQKREPINKKNYEFKKLNITRDLNSTNKLNYWTYDKLNESKRIAGIIKKRIIEESNESK